MPDKELHEANRLSWNAATQRHNLHKGDQAAFFRQGGSTLFSEEVDLLGPLHGKTLLHLQCNAGQDTLSIASQLGAAVTGVDISDEAVSFAQKLARDSNIPATFIRSDIYDWFEQNTEQYDVAFSSYGTTVWLSDLMRWGRGIADALVPGGRFVFVEFHPVATNLDYENYHYVYDYMGGTMVKEDLGVGDYVGDASSALMPDGMPSRIETVESFKNPHPAYEYSWGIADHVNAMLNAGMVLEHLQEYPYSNGYAPLANMRELPGRRMVPPESLPVIPLMFSMVARKPE